jgi:hypothetical protein
MPLQNLTHLQAGSFIDIQCLDSIIFWHIKELHQRIRKVCLRFSDNKNRASCGRMQ